LYLNLVHETEHRFSLTSSGLFLLDFYKKTFLVNAACVHIDHMTCFSPSVGLAAATSDSASGVGSVLATSVGSSAATSGAVSTEAGSAAAASGLVSLALGEGSCKNKMLISKRL
jgi:hypothetical protein